jgi:uncharacterized membrane protein YqhA
LFLINLRNILNLFVYFFIEFVLLLFVQIQEYLRQVIDMIEEFEEMLKEEPVIEFSGEVYLYLINLLDIRRCRKYNFFFA